MLAPDHPSLFPQPRRCALRRLAWACGLVLLGLSALPLRGDVSKEYQVKAAFLYNFTKFVEWPAARFADEASPIVIGLLGRNPFGGELEKIVRDRKVNGRSIVVVQLPPGGDALPLHALFVAAGEEGLVEKQIGTLIRAGVFVVGDSERFLALGGTVTFMTADDKVRFTINVAAAEQGGLKISAQLQKLATVVRR